MAADPPDGASQAKSERVKLTPMRVPKASDVLADDLRERILRDDFAEGTALPPERELVTQTRMSRTTVREALRVLEVQGFVQIKTGRLGGAYVRRPGPESMARSVSLLIRGRQIRIAALLETREGVEPTCARLAAKYRTDEDLDRLDAANNAVSIDGTLEEFLQANGDWHIAVAVASHNELLTGLMLALSRAIYDSTDIKGFIDVDVRRAAVKAHRTIADAIRDHDVEAAGRLMSRHVHEYATAVSMVEERTAIDFVYDEDD